MTLSPEFNSKPLVAKNRRRLFQFMRSKGYLSLEIIYELGQVYTVESKERWCPHRRRLRVSCHQQPNPRYSNWVDPLRAIKGKILRAGCDHKSRQLYVMWAQESEPNNSSDVEFQWRHWRGAEWTGEGHEAYQRWKLIPLYYILDQEKINVSMSTNYSDDCYNKYCTIHSPQLLA